MISNVYVMCSACGNMSQSSPANIEHISNVIRHYWVMLGGNPFFSVLARQRIAENMYVTGIPGSKRDFGYEILDTSVLFCNLQILMRMWCIKDVKRIYRAETLAV